MLMQIVVNGLIESSLSAVTATGFALIYSTTRVFHIAHGAAYVLGSYAGYFALQYLGLPAAVAVVLAPLAAALFGVVVERAVYRPMMLRRSSDLVLLLSSLGVYIMTINLVALIFGSENKTLVPGQSDILELGALIVTRVQLLQFAVSLMALALLMALVTRTSLGLTIRAVRDSPVLASVTGTDGAGVRLAVVAIGSGLAGLAAVLTAIDVGTDPNVGLPAFLSATAATVIGGTRTLLGPLCGALVIGITRSAVSWSLTDRWVDAVVFSVLVLTLVFRPEGILARAGRVEEAGA